MGCRRMTFRRKIASVFFFLFFALQASEGRVESASELDDYGDEFPTATLSNGRVMPLIGMGVGNLAHDQIVPVVTHALKGGNEYRLLDTARASHNEHLIADAIEMSGLAENTAVHVVTKVWYTHLGYERTRISAKESVDELLSKTHHSKNIRVHLLLHWPRCDDSIQWMNCEEEEEQLPQYVKDAGSPPHLDKINAWKESWKALEDMYDDDTLPIESIGISNFGYADLSELLSFCRHTPHLYQGNVWILLNDPDLINLFGEKGILFQAYNVMNGIVTRSRAAPTAFADLARLGAEIDEDVAFSPVQVILAWLVQNNVSIIPRASSPRHQTENSPQSIAKVALFTDEQHAQIRHCVKALLRGEDFSNNKLVSVHFINSDSSKKPIHLFWASHTGEEVPIKENLQHDQLFSQETYPGHRFIAYDETMTYRREYEVTASLGEDEHFHVEL